ncbi:zinc finger TRAF-type-containing protein 1 isoform X1 [Carettochelys insculpta]|uniref:zinc finger TRAF-type-containing protein 1 isoform X1 n=1 Tax=Carettochelys insculpta TaxID=44489 RepID=UPI003EBC6CBF
MSGAEEREPGGGGPAAAAAASASSSGAASSSAALGEAAGPAAAAGPEEPGLLLGGARPHAEPAADPDAPPKKRLKAAGAGGAEGAAGSVKLEERLYSVLCCTVCLDLPKASVYQVRAPPGPPAPPAPVCLALPKASVYQCTNGHLMCAGCFIHLLADARLKEEQATCPNCRCEISKSLCCRNLAVEKAVSELPSECGFCMRQFPRSLLERHQKEECQDRVTQCKYKRIGCPWQGPYHELTVHETECTHPTKTGNELMEILDEMDQTHKKEMQLYNSIFSLLSFEKIGYTEVQFRPYRTDDFITRLYYETPRFTVLNQTWVLKARVNDSERNPNLSCKRTLSFQLILKSKVSSPMECSFLLLKGPYDDVKINPVIYHFVFTNENNETEYVPLPIIDSVECNKLLAAKNINLRLFIFQIQK